MLIRCCYMSLRAYATIRQSWEMILLIEYSYTCSSNCMVPFNISPNTALSCLLCCVLWKTCHFYHFLWYLKPSECAPQKIYVGERMRRQMKSISHEWVNQSCWWCIWLLMLLRWRHIDLWRLCESGRGFRSVSALINESLALRESLLLANRLQVLFQAETLLKDTSRRFPCD